MQRSRILQTLKRCVEGAPGSESTHGRYLLDFIFPLTQQALGIFNAEAVDQCLEVASEIGIDGTRQIGSIRAENGKRLNCLTVKTLQRDEIIENRPPTIFDEQV